MSTATSGESPLQRIWENDGFKIAATMLAIYVLFFLIGSFLGYNLNGQMNTLRRLTFLTAVYGIAVLALNLQWGYTGLFNIGVAGFMAVGAYTFAMLTAAPDARVPGLGLWWPLAVVIAMAVTALASLLAALPALRLRADYLAIVTIALSEIIRYMYLSTAFQNFSLLGVKLGTGGGSGIGITVHPKTVIPELVLGNPVGRAIENALQGMGLVPSVISGWIYAFSLFLLVGAIYWLMRRIGFSPFGRVLKAIREDEDVANALGKNTRRFKIKAFMVGCAIMGLAGILWQASYGFINPNTFRPQVTFFVWIAVIIGGSGSNTGAVLGGALFSALLFEGPRYLANMVPRLFDLLGVQLGAAPNNFAGAVGGLVSLDIRPLVAYSIGNIASLRLVLMGVVLILLMQNRPEGLLGHRKETAAGVDLSRPAGGSTAATDGGDRDDAGGDRE